MADLLDEMAECLRGVEKIASDYERSPYSVLIEIRSLVRATLARYDAQKAAEPNHIVEPNKMVCPQCGSEQRREKKHKPAPMTEEQER